MPKGSEQLTASRREEIIDACARLYQTMSFKEITMKEIAGATSFTRPSLYNYFRTREEIFLALLQREYEAWNAELAAALAGGGPLTRDAFAHLLAETLSHREQLLRILSMNLYEIEENSRLECLAAFKRVYGASMDYLSRCLARAVPGVTEQESIRFLYAFFPFVYGIYPYTAATEKQQQARQAAGVTYHRFSAYEITLSAAQKLLGVN